MIFLALVALLIVPVAVADYRRGVLPLDRLGKQVGEVDDDG